MPATLEPKVGRSWGRAICAITFFRGRWKGSQANKITDALCVIWTYDMTTISASGFQFSFHKSRILQKQFREPTEFSTFYFANLKTFVKATVTIM